MNFIYNDFNYLWLPVFSLILTIKLEINIKLKYLNVLLRLGFKKYPKDIMPKFS